MVGESDGSLRLLETEDWREILSLPKLTYRVPQVEFCRFSPDGRALLTYDWGMLYLWDARTPQ